MGRKKRAEGTAGEGEVSSDPTGLAGGGEVSTVTGGMGWH